MQKEKAMQRIGRGEFSTAYLNADNGMVYLKSVCMAKECMYWGWFPDHPLFPVIMQSDVQGYDYMMQYYPKQRSLKQNLEPEQYAWYKELREAAAQILGRAYLGAASRYAITHDVFSTIQSAELREVMLDALDAMANYGDDVMFEISPRNVAVHNGKLVLLDCFAIHSQLVEQKETKVMKATFTIRIFLENDALEDEQSRMHELQRIVAEAAEHLTCCPEPPAYVTLRDINGNSAGFMKTVYKE